MNITNTMCRLSELTQEQIDSLVDAMPEFCFIKSRGGMPDISKIGFSRNNAGFWYGTDSTKIISYTEMMQLLGKTVEFTKSDLIKLAQSETVFVKQRDDNYGLALKDYAASSKHFHLYSDIDDNLIHSTHKSLDIMAVYKTLRIRCLDAHLNGQDLALIWERTEQAKVLQAKL
jgi:hypothetical protein